METCTDMRPVRIIARLDIKGTNVIKGIHLEGNRVVGDPVELSEKYYGQGIDEIIYMDAVASLYGRNSLRELVSRVARKIFIPLTVGGGIRSVEDVQALLSAGADKISVNTAAAKDPELITRLSRRYGSQCVVLSIEAKKKQNNGWEVMTDHGREHTGMDVEEWVRKAVALGAGEILVTSIDRDGTRKGFDIDLCRCVSEAVQVPVIISGGMGSPEDLTRVVLDGKADAVALADILHFERVSLGEIRAYALQKGMRVRNE
jgi:cyclase